MRLFVQGNSPPVRTSSEPSGAVMMAAHPPRAASVPFPEQAPSVTRVKVSAMGALGSLAAPRPRWPGPLHGADVADGRQVGRSFDRSAPEYDEILARNRMGAERLVAAMPPGEYPRVLDVGCGTGF